MRVTHNGWGLELFFGGRRRLLGVLAGSDDDDVCGGGLADVRKAGGPLMAWIHGWFLRDVIATV